MSDILWDTELDAHWCAEMRKNAGRLVRVTEGENDVGFVGELLGFSGFYNDGSAVLVIRNDDKTVVVSSDNIEYV